MFAKHRGGCFLRLWNNLEADSASLAFEFSCSVLIFVFSVSLFSVGTNSQNYINLYTGSSCAVTISRIQVLLNYLP